MLEAAGLLDQNGGRRRLADEREGTILIHGDDDRDHETDLLGGAVVKFLAESGDVYAMLTERRADRRRGGGFAGVDLQLDERSYFLRHRGFLLNLYVV